VATAAQGFVIYKVLLADNSFLPGTKKKATKTTNVSV
jgi:hypothetical protein